MRNGKAIESFIVACLETAHEMGLQRSELEKLRKVLVVTRADLSARSSSRKDPRTFPIPGLSKPSEAGEGVLG
jgi:hypothetical protein